MGQGQSSDSKTRDVPIEHLSHELANRFAAKCFTPLELYSFKDVFRTLADDEGSLLYWKEATLAKFLELPDALRAAPIIFQSVSFLGAFPFETLAPSILTFDALLKTVVIMTERYGKVLKKSKVQRGKILFRSLAVYDRRMSTNLDHEKQIPSEKPQDRPANSGFEVDEAVEDESDEDEDELALAALDALDVHDAFKFGNQLKIHHSQIPTDNFRNLIMLLLVLAPLDVTDRLSSQADMLSESSLQNLRSTADNILWAFGIEQHPGILYSTFDIVFHGSLPFLFDGLSPLFEHFLFSKNLNLSQRRNSQPLDTAPEPVSEPLLPSEGEILDRNVLSQLSFFIPGSSLFRRLRPLYFGSDAGFSLGSFETKVLKWMAPTILLVSGTVISDSSSSRAKEFVQHVGSSKYKSGAKGNVKSGHVTFGVYLHTPWRASTKECFGDEQSLLFQLEPIHEVFRASKVSTDYAHFAKSTKSGITFGCPLPKSTSLAASTHLSPGPVSLILDDSLEFGVFTHTAEGGGSYHPSLTREHDWQYKFEIESLEVWGCGGDEEAARQRQAWAFEEREALLRRNVNLGKDIEADRALLEMAGLIGTGRSGGSMA